MLSRLHLQNFTVFQDADFHFSPGLNVLVGTNGTGKSHVLKVGYGIMEVAAKGSPHPVDEDLGIWWHERLFILLLPQHQHDLIRRGSRGIGAEIKAEVTQPDFEISLQIERIRFRSERNGEVPFMYQPVFIPSKEVLSFYYGFLSLYERREVDYDFTYPELCKNLSLPLLREEPSSASVALKNLKSAMGGTVKLEGQRFVFVPNSTEQSKEDDFHMDIEDPLPINLYAEGLRKFGTLWQLLRNGSLTPETTLFWDEPEANLNPALLKKLAAVLAELARQGFQIILATHSLFLLKEFHILAMRDKQSDKPLPIRYFSLTKAEEPNAPVQVTAADDFIQLPDVAALDAELDQTFDFEEALHGRHAHD